MINKEMNREEMNKEEKPTKCSEYNLGISDNRMNHILSVARQCYHLAKRKYQLTEEESEKAFVIGFLHDIGYEFAKEKSDHPQVGANLLTKYVTSSIVEPIKRHGDPTAPMTSIMDKILNEADMTVNGKGNLVTMEERLEDVSMRLGKDSKAYKDCVLMSANLSENLESAILNSKGGIPYGCSNNPRKKANERTNGTSEKIITENRR